MNQKNYSKNISTKSYFNLSNQYNNILYALIIIIIVFIVVILLNFIYHKYQEARLKTLGINRIIKFKKGSDAYFESVRQNDTPKPTSQPSQNNSTQKVTEVNLEGTMIPCDLLKPCRLLNPQPKNGCCPDGIATIDKDVQGSCEIGADYRSSSEYQNTLKMCGY